MTLIITILILLFLIHSIKKSIYHNDILKGYNLTDTESNIKYECGISGIKSPNSLTFGFSEDKLYIISYKEAEVLTIDYNNILDLTLGSNKKLEIIDLLNNIRGNDFVPLPYKLSSKEDKLYFIITYKNYENTKYIVTRFKFPKHLKKALSVGKKLESYINAYRNKKI